MRRAGGGGGWGRRQGSCIFLPFTIWFSSAQETLSPAGPTPHLPSPAQWFPALTVPYDLLEL